MTVISEMLRIEQWLYTIFTADGTITGIVGNRIYAGVAPKSLATYPYIVFVPLSPGEDVDGPGAIRIWAAPLYLVKAVTIGTAQSLKTLVDRMEQLLQGARGGVADATIQFCKRERPHRMTTIEEPANTTYQHVGGEWRIAASPLVNP